MQNLIKYLFSLILISGFIVSCNKDNDSTINYETGANVAIPESYLQVSTPVISFQGGIPNYTYAYNVVKGVRNVTKVNIYKVFSDPKTGGVSNKALFMSDDIGNDVRTSVSRTFTYADLRSGLQVNGSDLPSSDTQVNIGASWKLNFTGVLSSGEEIPLKGSMVVAVLSPYAGLYRVVESEYFRIGVFSTDWNGETRFIGSVDETTYSYNDYWGVFNWTGNSFRFKIDPTTNKITAPILVNGALFSGSRAMSCPDDANLFISSSTYNCDNMNVLEKDPANPASSAGKHKIKLIYGYFTNGSGPREFYEVLEKI